MKKYEYKVITTLFRRERTLNQLGYEGWELVGVSDNILYLKREVTD